MNYPLYQGLLDQLIHKSLLSRVFIDEAHLFVQFGLFFRDEFLKLNDYLFSKLKISSDGSTTKVPIVFMSASLTKRHVRRLESMTGLIFDRVNNVLWPGPQCMRNRKQFVDVLFKETPMRTFLSLVEPLLKKNMIDGKGRKAIFYANSARKVKNYQDSYNAYLDKNHFRGDSVLIVGDMFKVEKFEYINTFIDTSNDVISVNGSILPPFDLSVINDPFDQHWDPSVCFMTRALGSAGLDSPRVYLVFSCDIPPDFLSFLQELGRAGRRKDASPLTDRYVTVFNLQNFTFRIKQIHWDRDESATVIMGNETLTKVQHQASLVNDFKYLFRSMVLPPPMSCFSWILEHRLANPFLHSSTAVIPLPTDSDRCNGCSLCRKEHYSQLKSVNVPGLKKILRLIFYHRRSAEPLDLETVFVDELCKYTAYDLWGTRVSAGKRALPSKKKPDKPTVKRTILMLIAADIIDFSVLHVVDKVGKKQMIIAALPSINFKSQKCWSMLPKRNDVTEEDVLFDESESD